MTITDTASVAAPVVQPVEWAPVPRVNLLPPEILAARGFRTVQRGLALALAGTVLACGGLVWWAGAGIDGAQEQLDAERAVTTGLRAEQSRYAEVPQVLSAVEAAETARQTAMATDIAWHTVLYDVSVVTPPTMWLQSLTSSVPMPGANASAPTAGPLDTPGAGVLTVTGQAPGFQDVADWLDAVDTVEGLDASILDTAVKDVEADDGPPYVTFTTHITVTSDAFTHRFDRKAR